ncbi:MAG: radical SAM family heme chaperone HemW [Anaerolineae bacterium]
MIATHPLSLYLHIPFCGTRCTYCAFNTYTTMDALIPQYVQALSHELRLVGSRTTAPVHTIYFGGGTPSLLSASQVQQVLRACYDSFDVLPYSEITLEVNPGSIDERYFAALRETGVNRLSVGMQSVYESELRLFGRDHDAAAVPITVRRARAAGFNNLSLDLIYGIPNQTLNMWQSSVEAALEIGADHLSMYALQLEDGTPLTKNVQQGWISKPDDDLAADMYDLADELANSAGLAQYEISNWARQGRECVHNLQYWRNLPYLGFGAGAHGYAAGIRYEVVRQIPRYLQLASSQMVPMTYPLTASIERHEAIDVQTQMAEHLMTGLRLVREGINIRAFAERFGVDIDVIYGDLLRKFEGYGLLVRDDTTIKLTKSARLISNLIFVELFGEKTA